MKDRLTSGMNGVICVKRPNKMHFFLLMYFNDYPLHVSNRLTIHHQEVVYCICSMCYLSYITAD
jgi:hypothetical protein